MLENITKISREDIIIANENLIKKAAFEKKYPLISKIKNYFTQPKKYQCQIGEDKKIPNFYTDFLGYKIKKIVFSKEEINEAYKKAFEKNKI